MRPTLPLTSAGGVGRQSCGVRYYRPPRGRDTLKRPMAANRVFFPQEALEVWTADGRASVEAETMLLGGTRFLLTTGLRFTAEVAGGGDPEGLVGKCKSVEQVAEIGGEHYADSVVLGENAYEVVEGFLAEPVLEGTQSADADARLLALFTEG